MTRPLTHDRLSSPLRSLGSAVVALGCLLGVGVFLVPALGVAAAGPWLPPAVAVALLAAWCTVSSSAVVAAARGHGHDSHVDAAGTDSHAEAPKTDDRRAHRDGTHLDLREQLGVWPARLSGVAFLSGQLILAAGIAGVLADHLWSGRSWAGPLVIAVATTLLIARLPRPRGLGLLPIFVIGVLAIVVAAAVALEPAPSPAAPAPAVDISGVAEAAAMTFLAFCGFERFTTRGDRVGRAATAPMIVALFVSTGLVLVVAFAGWHQLGPHRFGLSPTPLLDLVVAADAAPLATLVGLAVLAALLPPVIAALSSARDAMRVAIAEGDVRWPSSPSRFGSAEPTWAVELVIGLAAGAVVLLFDPAAALALGCCLLLIHYAFLNAAARLVAGEQDLASARRGCTGMFASVILAMSLPVAALAGTAVILAAGGCALALSARRWR
ncbi:APA family basic amino acid/polyamine antiporter [Actinoalloteichus hoggarensis]|uniref:Uncharacterized protein n=1 Tax=Actinoalloteichus hoggarensis TaxID=1470176 RepID=A0A221W882_9PSEU|nr:hypothetical protein [Actinoalloteichus hoggarensis]ASO22210.1 hypothetical protein AHOG_22985 [Actinoalloteichus hoggarensis]MBB5923705.1 APA family basic amino acid/polyamine antiporter [Actinoalloteichus hoggarensis]